MALPYILQRVEAAGHTVFERGELNLNIVLVRSASRVPDRYDDTAHILYRQLVAKGYQWKERIYRITTDPGLYYLQHPMLPKGCAILAPGQYRGAWRIGLHRGAYPALVQSGAEVAVYRDRDLDDTLDPTGPLDWGWHGINMHRSAEGWTSTEVGTWSAGCAVWADADDHTAFMDLCRASAEVYGDRFSGTLLDASQL